MAEGRALAIDLLGRFRATLGEAAWAGSSISGRGRELLALLLLASGSGASREWLAAQVWPESTDAQARTNLRRELHQLRRQLPRADEVLEARGRSLRARVDAGAIRSDLVTFRAALARAAAAPEGDAEAEEEGLSAAVEAYAGDLMPECLSEWILPERDRLRGEAVAALRRLTALRERRGALAEGIACARRWVELEPYDEVAYRALMRLHAASGNRGAAVQVFHRCAGTLQRELGLEPDDETAAAYEELLASSGATAPGGVVVPSPAGSATDAPEAVALVGREEDLRHLREVYRASVTGAASVACILGEAGIGKSRLAEALAREVERSGATVARGRAYAAEGQLSYSPVVTWLRCPPMRARLAELEPAWRTELERLLPEVRGPGGVASADFEDPSPHTAYRRRRLMEAVARALLAGESPVLLVLDDLQWCDPETLALLHFLTRFEEGAPRAVVATARIDELADNAAAKRLLVRLREEGRLLERELGPLDRGQIEALARASSSRMARAAAGEAASRAMDRLYTLSEGNPLFALEALRAGLHLEEPAGAGAAVGAAPLLASSALVRGVLSARLSQLGPRALEAAQYAATMGRAFAFEGLRATTELEEVELVSALDELWRRRIVREHGAELYDFSHDALREAVLSGLSAARAGLLHRRVAQALAATHGDDLDDVSAALAVHWERGGVPERAIASYRRAARTATAVFAHGEAERLLDRALALVALEPEGEARDREEVALLIGKAPSLRAVGGYVSQSLAVAMERARSLAERCGDAAGLFQALRNLLTLRFVSGDMRAALRVARRLRELAAQVPELEGESHHTLAGVLLHLGAFPSALRHFEAARSHYDPRDARRHVTVFGSDLGVFNCAWEAHGLWLSGRAERALASCEEAIALARDLEHAYSEALAQAYAAILHYMRRDRAACAQAADAARDVCGRYGFAYYRHWGVLWGAWARSEDDPAAAAAAIRTALAGLNAEGAWVRRPLYLAALAEVLLETGREDEAVAALDEAEARALRTGESMWGAELARVRASLPGGREAPRSSS